VNKGGSAARNTGIRHARAAAVVMLDDDDLIKPTHIEKLYNKLTDLGPEWGLVYSGYEVRKGDKKVNAFYPKWKGNVSDKILTDGGVGTTAVAIIRKKIIKKAGMFDEKLPRYQDIDMYVRLAESTKFYPLNEVTVVKNETGTPTLGKLKKARKIFQKKYSSKIDNLEDRRRRKYEAGELIRLARVGLNEDRYVKSVIWLVKALMVYPGKVRAVIGVLLYNITNKNNG
jgi:glycosyltransferase involved in cell wall biosynthesis